MEVFVAVIILVAIVVFWASLAHRRSEKKRSSVSPPSYGTDQYSEFGPGIDHRQPYPSFYRPTSVSPEQISLASDRCWVPPGQTISVGRRELLDGMVYVGSDLPGISPYVSVDPALIDPSLPVDSRSPDYEGSHLGYWPSYSEIPASSRAAYLDWLAEGRPPGTYIGYVFIFFYGIERRVLFDAKYSEEARGDIPALLEEVERLLEHYGTQNSFRRYAEQFVSTARLLLGPIDVTSVTPPMEKQGWELPAGLKLGLGTIIAAGEPLPASWALS